MFASKNFVLATAFIAFWSMYAVASEETDTVDLTAQIELLRDAEASSQATVRTIEALNTAYLMLRSDEFEVIERLLDDARTARDETEEALEGAGSQLEQARVAVERFLDQIKIEGAEKVEIGGEIRAARTLVIGWQRLLETETANLAQLRKEIARIDAFVAVANSQ